MTPIAMSTAAWFFIGIPLLVIWAIAIVDIIRRDIPTGTKAAWILVVLILPVIGTIAYFVMRKPTEQEVRRAVEAQQDQASDWPKGVRRRLPDE
jgi:hypothetical protein